MLAFSDAIKKSLRAMIKRQEVGMVRRLRCWMKLAELTSDEASCSLSL